MALITELLIFNLIHPAGYTGQASGSYGNQEMLSLETNEPFVKEASFNTTINVTTGYNTYYKMQGWNPISQVYEDWHSMGTPLLDPPSGNTLENIGIIGTWIDR